MAVEALKDAEVHVKGMVAIFTYGFDVAAENFKKANVDLHTLADYGHLLDLAVAKNYITEKELKTLQEWRESPSTWNV
jgi:orotate phosphoribosyltransferase